MLRQYQQYGRPCIWSASLAHQVSFSLYAFGSLHTALLLAIPAYEDTLSCTPPDSVSPQHTADTQYNLTHMDVMAIYTREVLLTSLRLENCENCTELGIVAECRCCISAKTAYIKLARTGICTVTVPPTLGVCLYVQLSSQTLLSGAGECNQQFAVY